MLRDLVMLPMSINPGFITVINADVVMSSKMVAAHPPCRMPWALHICGVTVNSYIVCRPDVATNLADWSDG